MFLRLQDLNGVVLHAQENKSKLAAPAEPHSTRTTAHQVHKQPPSKDFVGLQLTPACSEALRRPIILMDLI